MSSSLATLDALPLIGDFYAHYWNKRPFLVRGAIDSAVMNGLITPDELAGLSMEETASSRMVVREDWACKFGPFTEEDFNTEGNPPWSLLVQNVEQFHPDTATLLRAFNFAPRWLMDDVMVSYSTADGTIGGLRQALESLQAEHSATSAKLAQLQMSTTLQDLEEAEATVKEMEGEIRDLKAENEELHRRLEELSSRVGANHRKMKVGRVQAAAPCASAATRCNRRLPLRRRPPYVLPGGAHAQPAEDQLQRGAARHPRSRTAKCDGGDGGGGGAEGAADARGDARSRDAAAGARGAQDPTKRRVTQGAHSERTPGGRRAPL